MRYALLVGLLSLSLTGCGDGKAETKTTPKSKSETSNSGAKKTSADPFQSSTVLTDAKKQQIQELEKQIQNLQGEPSLPLADAILKIDPAHFRANSYKLNVWKREAGALYQKGEYEEAAERQHNVIKLIESFPEQDSRAGKLLRSSLNIEQYNLACILALDKQPTKAMTALQSAVENGFHSLEQIRSDSDLDSLRDLPEYEKLIAAAQQAAADALVTQLKEFKSYPFKFAADDVHGKPISTDDLKGKIAIIDFWGTWCPPCRKEIPHFVALHDKYEDQGFQVVGINTERDIEGEPEEEQAALKTQKIKQFMDDYNMNYRCVLDESEIGDQVPNFTGYPTTIFLDRTGKVRMQLVGYHPLPKLESIVQALLAE